LSIDIFLTINVLLAAWIGWFAGFTRTFFAVLAGFLAVFVAGKYPYQEGLNVYLIFIMTAFFVIILGNFVLRVVNFFYLSFLDRIGGVVLNICVWLVLCVILVIPVATGRDCTSDNSTCIYKAVSSVLSEVPCLKNYVPLQLLIDKFVILKKWKLGKL